MYVQGGLYDKLQCTKGTATAAAAVEKKANESVVHQKRMSGLNKVSNLSGRVVDLEITVGFLYRRFLRSQGS